MNGAVFGLVLLAVIYAMWQEMLPKLQCFYCGRVGGHEDDCPRKF